MLEVQNLAIGAQVELSVERGKSVAQVATRPRKRYAMVELLEGAAVIQELNAESLGHGRATPSAMRSPDGLQ